MLTETKARSLRRSLHIAARIPMPLEVLEPTDHERELMEAIWMRYQKEKEALPPMPPEKYEREIKFIAERLGL
jgi:hypothetical protein